MPKKQLETLTEPMYYTLIALLEARCGMEITEFVLTLTQGRVHLVPGTLYTTIANPACIKKTRKAAIQVHTIFNNC